MSTSGTIPDLTATATTTTIAALAKITDGASVALSARSLVGGTTTVLAGQPVMVWQRAARLRPRDEPV